MVDYKQVYLLQPVNNSSVYKKPPLSNPQKIMPYKYLIYKALYLYL